MINIYFPTTDFLAKLEMSNSGSCEDRIDKDDVFFEIYNRPAYCDEVLLSNFNNKLHKFFEAFPALRKIRNKKIVRFFEYSTLNHKKPGRHQLIASGSNSWTLAYYCASLMAVLECGENTPGKYKNIVFSGSIGEFTPWDQINHINRINEKLNVTAEEFFKNPELSAISELSFFYKTNESLNLDALIEKNKESGIILEKKLLNENSIKLTNLNRSIILNKIENIQDFLKIQYPGKFSKSLNLPKETELIEIGKNKLNNIPQRKPDVDKVKKNKRSFKILKLFGIAVSLIAIIIFSVLYNLNKKTEINYIDKELKTTKTDEPVSLYNLFNNPFFSINSGSIDNKEVNEQIKPKEKDVNERVVNHPKPEAKTFMDNPKKDCSDNGKLKLYSEDPFEHELTIKEDADAKFYGGNFPDCKYYKRKVETENDANYCWREVGRKLMPLPSDSSNFESSSSIFATHYTYFAGRCFYYKKKEPIQPFLGDFNDYKKIIKE